MIDYYFPKNLLPIRTLHFHIIPTFYQHFLLFMYRHPIYQHVEWLSHRPPLWCFSRKTSSSDDIFRHQISQPTSPPYPYLVHVCLILLIIDTVFVLKIQYNIYTKILPNIQIYNIIRHYINCGHLSLLIHVDLLFCHDGELI